MWQQKVWPTAYRRVGDRKPHGHPLRIVPCWCRCPPCNDLRISRYPGLWYVVVSSSVKLVLWLLVPTCWRHKAGEPEVWLCPIQSLEKERHWEDSCCCSLNLIFNLAALVLSAIGVSPVTSYHNCSWWWQKALSFYCAGDQIVRITIYWLICVSGNNWWQTWIWRLSLSGVSELLTPNTTYYHISF